MRLFTSMFAIALAATVFGQIPPATTDGSLELRATQAFNKGDYGSALPMLKSLTDNLKDQPDKLGMVQEQIRVCEKNLAAPPATRPAAVDPVVATRTPHPAPKDGESLEMNIKDLGNFDYDVDNNKAVIPDDVKALSSHTVKMHGFMVPLDQAENISKFALVPSLFNCCYGQPPQIQHTIIVTCPKGKAVQYCADEIVVEGTLTVNEIKDDGYVIGIFAVQCQSVKPAVK